MAYELYLSKAILKFGSFLKVKSNPMIESSHSIPRYLPKRTENICPHEDCTPVFIAASSVIVPNWKQPKQTTNNKQPCCLSNNRRMDKQIAVYSHHELLLSNKKESTIHTHNNMDKPQNNYAE